MDELEQDALVLNRVADGAEYLAALAEQAGEVEKAERIRGEAQILVNWANLCLAVIANQQP